MLRMSIEVTSDSTHAALRALAEQTRELMDAVAATDMRSILEHSSTESHSG
jgi:hypothetical protein